MITLTKISELPSGQTISPLSGTISITGLATPVGNSTGTNKLYVDGAIGTIVNQEIPSGTINGSTTAFTLAHTPVAGSVALYLAGARQWNNTSGDYTISGTTITFAIAPTVGPLLADYRY